MNVSIGPTNDGGGNPTVIASSEQNLISLQKRIMKTKIGKKLERKLNLFINLSLETINNRR